MTKPKDIAKDGKLIEAKPCLASKWSYLGKEKLKTKSLDKLQNLMKKERKIVLHSVQATWPSLRKKR